MVDETTAMVLVVLVVGCVPAEGEVAGTTVVLEVSPSLTRFVAVVTVVVESGAEAVVVTTVDDMVVVVVGEEVRSPCDDVGLGDGDEGVMEVTGAVVEDGEGEDGVVAVDDDGVDDAGD